MLAFLTLVYVRFFYGRTGLIAMIDTGGLRGYNGSTATYHRSASVSLRKSIQCIRLGDLCGKIPDGHAPLQKTPRGFLRLAHGQVWVERSNETVSGKWRKWFTTARAAASGVSHSSRIGESRSPSSARSVLSAEISSSGTKQLSPKTAFSKTAGASFCAANGTGGNSRRSRPWPLSLALTRTRVAVSIDAAFFI